MQVDEPSAGATVTPAQSQINNLTEEKDLHWRSRQERENFQQLKPRTFSLTNMYDPRLLLATSMDAEFDLIFHVVGWEKF